MKRRNFLASAAALPAAGVAQTPSAKGKLETEIKRLKLKHTWTTTMSSSQYRDTIHVRLTRDGITGHGEGAPIPRYKEDAKSAQAALERFRIMMETEPPFHFQKILNTMTVVVEGQYAAKAAADMAMLDWITQKFGIPLCNYFGLDPKMAPITTFSIGIDTPEITRQKVREAADFPILKVKVGLKTDEQTLEAVRSETQKPLRVDANEGWTDKEEAVRKILWLEKMGVQFIEQPMPAHMIEETKWVRKRVHIPIIADEACQHPWDIPKLAEAYDGVNVKLDKAGGVMEAYRMIMMARSLSMRTMIGCMISSSCSVTAAAHLSPLVTYADLDGNLLIGNDPFQGVRVEGGKLILPNRPGIGLLPA
jgi:L-Ala-D/L-Glu epimerase